MFFVVRSNDSFNFPLGLIKYIVTNKTCFRQDDVAARAHGDNRPRSGSKAALHSLPEGRPAQSDTGVSGMLQTIIIINNFYKALFFNRS